MNCSEFRARFFLSLVFGSLLTANVGGAESPITAAAFAPDGSALVASQAGLRRLSWPKREPLAKIPSSLGHIHDLAFSPTGDSLAIAGGEPGEKGSVELLRWPKGDRLARLEGHDDLVHAVAWSPDGRLIVSASADGTCRVFEAAGGKHRLTFTGHAGPVHAVIFLPEGLVISAGGDQSLRLWDTATGKTLRVMENHTAAIHALAVRPGLPKGSLPVVASAGADRTVRLWQPTIGRLMRFRKLPSPVLSLAWTPDGERLLAGGTDGKVRLLDPDSLDVLKEDPPLPGWLYTLAVSPTTGDILAGGEKGQIARLRMPR